MGNAEKIIKTFSTNLKYYMKKNNVTSKEISSFTNLSKQSVSNWINGKLMPRMPVVEMLSQYFNITKADLLEKKTLTNSLKQKDTDSIYLRDTTTKRINYAMNFRNITQAELARRTKLGRPTINQYVKGVVVPKQDRIFMLAESLNVSPLWLMGKSENINKVKQINNLLIEDDMITKLITILHTTGAPVIETLTKLSKLNEIGILKLIDYMNFLLTKSENIQIVKEAQNFDDI